MNAKDCESIAYILADTDASEEVREKFFALDPRIQDDWEAYTVVLARQRHATERFAELMVADLIRIAACGLGQPNELIPDNRPMISFAHRFYLHGYHGHLLPRLVRKLIARTMFHRSWLAGHMGVFEQDGVRLGVADRDSHQYRNR